MPTLIQNGTLVLPDGPVKADLRIADGKITELGPGLAVNGDEVIDASGKLVFPGFIDTHTHFEMNKGLINETADNWETGTRSAIAGGTTCVLDFAEPEHGHSLQSALDAWHSRADGHASCNYSFHMTIVDWDQRIRDELPEMTRQGITSYKVYLAYDGMRIPDGTAYEVIRAVKREGGIVGCHCENGDLIDESIAELKAAGKLGPSSHPLAHSDIIESEGISRWLHLSAQAEYPVVVVHLSTQRGLEQALLARSHGQPLYLETCPQYLSMTDEKYQLPGFESAKYVFSPPLRKQDDVDALWEALGDDEIDTIGTDHCSFRFDTTKQLGKDDFSQIPPGIPGVEHRPAIIYTLGVKAGRINLMQMLEAMCENPARLYGMYPRKGVLAVGSDADITIFDPDYKWTISAANQHQNLDYTPYEGMEMAGRADTVLLGGQVAVRGGELVQEGLGRFVHRGPAQFWR